MGRKNEGRGEDGRKKTHNLILDTVDFSPRTHNERIVEGNACYDIDALCLQNIEVFNVGWEMTDGAGWSECTWTIRLQVSSCKRT